MLNLEKSSVSLLIVFSRLDESILDSTRLLYYKIDEATNPLLKQNTDGCFKSNLGISGGGGVLIDYSRRLIIAYPCLMGHMTSLQVKVESLLIIIHLCHSKGFGKFVVELDSQVLIYILQGKCRYPLFFFKEASC